MFRFLGQYIPLKSVGLAISETALIFASIWAAAWMRMRDGAAVAEYFDQPYMVLKLVAILVVCWICFYLNELYDLQLMSRHGELLLGIMRAIGSTSIILALLYFLIPDLSPGRGVSVIAAFTASLLVWSWRLLLNAGGSFFTPAQRILIAGTGAVGIRLVREILSHPELNFKVIGFLDEEGENIGKPLVNPGIVGGMAEVQEFVRREAVDRVVLSFGDRRGKMPMEELLQVKLAGVQVEDAHFLYEKLTGRIILDRLFPSSLILSDGFRRSATLRVLKRSIDIIVSLLALLLLAPVWVLISIAIFIESGPPILFRQQRIGLKGHPFQILKFRSMRRDAEQNGAAWTVVGDERITRVGRLIRRCRFDEIPQFFNVLRGDMSVVGPRPEQPAFVKILEKQIPYYGGRHCVRPGITGWAQIKHKYGSSIEDAKSKLEYDLFYIKHMSVSFDLFIVFRTVQVVLFGKGVV